MPGYLSHPGSHNYFCLGAQKVKSWPADLAVPSSIPTRGGNLNRKWDHYAQRFSLLVPTSHCPDMTEILLRRT